MYILDDEDAKEIQNSTRFEEIKKLVGEFKDQVGVPCSGTFYTKGVEGRIRIQTLGGWGVVLFDDGSWIWEDTSGG